MRMEMQKVDDPLKVGSIMDNMYYSKEKIYLWQEKRGILRKTHSCRIMRIDKYRGELIFSADQKNFEFDRTDELYCLWESEVMAFKTHVEFMSDFKMAVKIPKFIMTKEKRTLGRVECLTNKVNLTFEYGYDPNKSYSILKNSVSVFDYNHKGISLRVPAASINKFSPGDMLTMKLPFLGHKLVVGKVKHISKFDQQTFKVGIVLS